MVFAEIVAWVGDQPEAAVEAALGGLIWEGYAIDDGNGFRVNTPLVDWLCSPAHIGFDRSATVIQPHQYL